MCQNNLCKIFLQFALLLYNAHNMLMFYRANLTNADFRKMLMTPAPKQAKVKPQVTIANVEKEKLKERERRLKEKKV